MEELQLVIRAMENLGAAGKEAFIYWLIADKVLPFILWGFVIFGIFWCTKTTVYLSEKMHADSLFLVEIAKELGINVTLPVTDGEQYSILKAIRELKK